MFDFAADRGGGHARIQLDRVLSGLRHLEGSHEPARVFAGLVQICVPALCDECLIEVTEQATRPYRIRRVRSGLAPFATPDRDSPEDRPGGPASREVADPLGVTVISDGPWIRARFASSAGSGPRYQGVLACRWDGGYCPTPSDRALVGVLVDHAVALVHRERAALAGTVADPAGSRLPMPQRIAAASGILMALYHLSPVQARQLLSRASEHTSASLGDVADTVLRTGALPPPPAGHSLPDRSGRRDPGPVDPP